MFLIVFSILFFFIYILWHLKLGYFEKAKKKNPLNLVHKTCTESRRLLCSIASISTCENTVLLQSTGSPLRTYSFPYWMYRSLCVHWIFTFIYAL